MAPPVCRVTWQHSSFITIYVSHYCRSIHIKLSTLSHFQSILFFPISNVLICFDNKCTYTRYCWTYIGYLYCCCACWEVCDSCWSETRVESPNGCLVRKQLWCLQDSYHCESVRLSVCPSSIYQHLSYQNFDFFDFNLILFILNSYLWYSRKKNL